MMMKGIKTPCTFGVEIEGGIKIKQFDDLHSYCNTVGWNVGSDSSVSVNGENIEIRTKPYNRKELKTFQNHLFALYNFFKIEANDSCGVHIHISPEKVKDMNLLHSYHFFNYFIKKYGRTFRSREDRNRRHIRYCKLYSHEEQFNRKTKLQLCGDFNERYYAVNYHSFNKFRTIEFRIFAGTSNPEKIMRYLLFLFKVIDDYTRKNSQRYKLLRVTEQVSIKKNQLNGEIPFNTRNIYPVTKKESINIHRKSEDIPTIYCLNGEYCTELDFQTGCYNPFEWNCKKSKFTNGYMSSGKWSYGEQEINIIVDKSVWNPLEDEESKEYLRNLTGESD